MKNAAHFIVAFLIAMVGLGARTLAAEAAPAKDPSKITHSFLATGGKTYIVEYVEPKAEANSNGSVRKPTKPREDVLFDDFEKPGYVGWVAKGTAFGEGPIVQAKMPSYQGDVKSQGKRLVNTHNTRQSEEVGGGDAHTGTLTSKSFTIDRRYVRFLVGGGAHKDKTCINLYVDGKVVKTATGKNNNLMGPAEFDVKEFAGKQAYFRIVDEVTGRWGNIGVDHIVFTDSPLNAAAKEKAGYQITWVYPLPTRDGWVLPNGRILLAIGKCSEYPKGGAIEIDREGTKYWEFKGTQSEVDTVQKTHDGNYLVTVAGPNPMLYEFSQAGARRMMFGLPSQKKNHHMQQRMSRKLANGNYLTPHLFDKKIIEYKPGKGQVRVFHTPHWPFTAIRLSNGNTLTTCTYGRTAIEFDKEGDIVWQVKGDELEGTDLNDACGAQRLPNGNTIICDYAAGSKGGPKLIEVTRDKKVVWTYNNAFRHGIHHVHVFKTNGKELEGTPLR